MGKNATTGAAHSLDSAAHDSEMAESVVRRLKVELDRKCSELDSSLKEADTVRAELKEMKALFNAAGQEADAAGADEQTLRKRLSQLVCENGLLKGEKDRREALDALAKTESRSAAVRASVEIDRLERELEVGRSTEPRYDGYFFSKHTILFLFFSCFYRQCRKVSKVLEGLISRRVDPRPVGQDGIQFSRRTVL